MRLSTLGALRMREGNIQLALSTFADGWSVLGSCGCTKSIEASKLLFHWAQAERVLGRGGQAWRRLFRAWSALKEKGLLSSNFGQELKGDLVRGISVHFRAVEKQTNRAITAGEISTVMTRLGVVGLRPEHIEASAQTSSSEVGRPLHEAFLCWVFNA